MNNSQRGCGYELGGLVGCETSHSRTGGDLCQMKWQFHRGLDVGLLVDGKEKRNWRVMSGVESLSKTLYIGIMVGAWAGERTEAIGRAGWALGMIDEEVLVRVAILVTK